MSDNGSEFFTEVTFDEEKDPASNKPETVVKWDTDKLAAAFVDIEAEIEKVKAGTSDLTPRAIHPGKFNFPAMSAIKSFVADPSDKAWQGLVDIMKQDFGARFGTWASKLLNEAREVHPNE
jgi:hypothetical protein